MGLGIGIGISPTLGQGVGINPPFAAPSGYVWDFFSDSDGALLTDTDGQPFIALFLIG